MKLIPFVYAALSLTGKPVIQHPDEYHPAPEADLVLGPNPEDWNYPDWVQDRHGQIRKGGMLKSLGRYLYELHDVVLARLNGRVYLILAPGVVAADATPSAGLKLPENAEMQVDLQDGRVGVNLMPSYEIVSHETRPAVLYAHDWAGNLFHHYVDTVPRHWAADEGLLPPDVIEAKAPVPTRFDTLYFPSFWPVTGYAPTTISYLREKANLGPAPPQWTSILYLTRSDTKTRRVTNEHEVIRFLADRGHQLSVYCMGSFSLAEQATIIRQHPLIIGPHGAAMMNTVFTEGAAVIEFVPESRQPVCYQYLAKWAGNWYGRIICPDGENQDMTVDLDMLSQALTEAGKR